MIGLLGCDMHYTGSVGLGVCSTTKSENIFEMSFYLSSTEMEVSGSERWSETVRLHTELLSS